MSFDLKELQKESLNRLAPEARQFCPECGGPMEEADRAAENGAVYVWYQCPKPNCIGSWLKKTA